MSQLSPFFAKRIAPNHSVTIMEHAGFKASLMRAHRLIGDHVHAGVLPVSDKFLPFLQITQ